MAPERPCGGSFWGEPLPLPPTTKPLSGVWPKAVRISSPECAGVATEGLTAGARNGTAVPDEVGALPTASSGVAVACFLRPWIRLWDALPLLLPLAWRLSVFCAVWPKSPSWPAGVAGTE